jgi:hypothetical protein
MSVFIKLRSCFKIVISRSSSKTAIWSNDNQGETNNIGLLRS